MIDDPDRWAPGLRRGRRRQRHRSTSRPPPTRCRPPARSARAGALAGLAVKPGTPLEPYLDLLREFDTLLVMTVEPGFGGQEFIAEVLPKVRLAREHVRAGHLRLFIEVDGGIDAGHDRGRRRGRRRRVRRRLGRLRRRRPRRKAVEALRAAGPQRDERWP